MGTSGWMVVTRTSLASRIAFTRSRSRRRGPSAPEESGWSVKAGPLLDVWIYQPLPERRVVIVTSARGDAQEQFLGTAVEPFQETVAVRGAVLVMCHDQRVRGRLPVAEVVVIPLGGLIAVP